MPPTFVTLRTFQYPSDAHPIQARLEAEGITTFLEGENSTLTDAVGSNVLNTVLLKVPTGEAERALAILGELEPSFHQQMDAAPDQIIAGFKRVDTYCPNCDARNAFRRHIPAYLFALAILFAPLIIILVVSRKKHYCGDCHHEWKQ